jgi:peroxiredoxin
MESQTKTFILHDVIRRFATGGKDITPALWQDFVEAQNDGYRTGPAVGEPVPDFTLPDQYGTPRSLHDVMGSKGLLLAFTRSADWWPYCRNQLVELNLALEALRTNGIHAASITYDTREILHAFGEAYRIGYPLLSDVGSRVIRAFGILNTNIPEDHAMMYGIPWPGNYLIAPNKTVQDKLFLRDYQLRPSAAAVLFRNVPNAITGIATEITTDVLQATVRLSTDRCFPGQEIAVGLNVRLTPGWHVYGPAVASPYQALELTFESPLVADQALSLPPPTPVLLTALGETLLVYTGDIQAVGSLRIKWSPPVPVPFMEAFGATIEPGAYTISGTLRFQGCNDDLCETPQAIPFTIPLRIEAGIPSAPKP